MNNVQPPATRAYTPTQSSTSSAAVLLALPICEATGSFDGMQESPSGVCSQPDAQDPQAPHADVPSVCRLDAGSRSLSQDVSALAGVVAPATHRKPPVVDSLDSGTCCGNRRPSRGQHLGRAPIHFGAEQQKTELVDRRIDALVPNGSATRVHGPEQIKQIVASIKEFGFTNPLLIDNENRVMAGMGRLVAAMDLGMTTVPCIVLHGLTEAQRAAYAIADNKIALNAHWDDAALSAELERLAGVECDLSALGFSESELEALLASGLTNLDSPFRRDDHADRADELLIWDELIAPNPGSERAAKEPAPPVSKLVKQEDGSPSSEDSAQASDSAGRPAASPPRTALVEAQDAWKGMPEFNQVEAGPYQTIRVHCVDQAAVDAFAKLIGKKLTDRTKYIWFPEAEAQPGAVYE